MPTLAELAMPQLMSDAKTVGADTKAALLGKMALAETLLDPNADLVSMKWDITEHGEGHNGVMTATLEISLDDRKTWEQLASASRDKGYAPIETKDAPSDFAYLTVGLPQIGSTVRWIRGTLAVNKQTVSTSFQICPVDSTKQRFPAKT